MKNYWNETERNSSKKPFYNFKTFQYKHSNRTEKMMYNFMSFMREL